MTETVTSRCERSKGRRIPRETIVRLIATAAGRCASPICKTGVLWHELSDGSTVRLGEVAHIVAAQSDGPRGDSSSDEQDLTSFDNLMLLCLNCHTIVDRAPDDYPVAMLREWKESHALRIAEALGAIRYTSRSQARLALAQIFDENRIIWDTYGPESPNSWHPEAASIWLQTIRSTVLPNNMRIQQLVAANLHLLTPAEQRLASEFSAHARALEQRHLGGVIDPFAPRFPAGFDQLFTD